MVKHIVFITFLFLIGCEMNSEQLIKSEKINFENIKFNTVSKDLKFSHNEEGQYIELTQKLINEWFNSNIKVDGFDGNLNVNVSNIEIKTLNKDDYYRFEINLHIEFLETYEKLNKKKIYKVNSLEFGDIQGSFSIKEKEDLSQNIIIKSLKSINKKILEM